MGLRFSPPRSRRRLGHEPVGFLRGGNRSNAVEFGSQSRTTAGHRETTLRQDLRSGTVIWARGNSEGKYLPRAYETLIIGSMLTCGLTNSRPLHNLHLFVA